MTESPDASSPSSPASASQENAAAPRAAGAEEQKPTTKTSGFGFQKNLIAGVFTIVPLAITWVVFEMVIAFLADVGGPAVTALADALMPHAPLMAEALHQRFVQGALAIAIIIIGLYVLGAVTTQVLGQRLITAAENFIARIPLVKIVYGLVKQLVGALRQKPGAGQRVVLIDFPHKDMKTIGLMMRELKDRDTGRALAAVYVPTAPNPTSGYIEIVPLAHIVPTDWTVDEAMAFIVSGGTVAKDTVNFDRPAKTETP